MCLKHEKYEIHITRDYKNCETYYLLYVGNIVVGFTGDTYVQRDELPTTLRSECVYALS